MALLNGYTNETTGLTIENAYFKARKEAQLKGNEVIFSCDVYTCEIDRRDGKQPLASVAYELDNTKQVSMNEDTRVTMLYGLLKLLPEFADSEDSIANIV